jgi:hypothetical protein
LAYLAYLALAGRTSVFCDLGFDEAEAHVLAMRADLMAALREHIKDRGWTLNKDYREMLQCLLKEKARFRST